MNTDYLINRLAAFPSGLQAVLHDVDAGQAQWKPKHGAWSIQEIVRHLADEEAEDFRPRLQRTLQDPREPWDAIDPEGAAIERSYNSGSFAEAVARFCALRTESVRWLRHLSAPDWSLAYAHPSLGPIRAGDLLVAWVAHDALHLRQVAKRFYEQTLAAGALYHADYAGSWGA